jgi:hypothetical protein
MYYFDFLIVNNIQEIYLYMSHLEESFILLNLFLVSQKSVTF